jgi:hypothetical protein
MRHFQQVYSKTHNIGIKGNWRRNLIGDNLELYCVTWEDHKTELYGIDVKEKARKMDEQI